MTSKELYDAGYALPLYDISNEVQRFQFRDERFVTSGVPMHEVGLPFKVAKIGDVRG